MCSKYKPKIKQCMSDKLHKHSNFLLPLYNRAMFGSFAILILYNLSLVQGFYALPFFIVLGLCIPILTITEGIMIDRKKKKYKHYLQFLGIKFRRWHTYKEIRLILIVKYKGVPNVTNQLADMIWYSPQKAYTQEGNSMSYRYFFCVQIEENDHRFFIKKSRKLDMLHKIAEPYEKFLDIPLEDCIPAWYK